MVAGSRACNNGNWRGHLKKAPPRPVVVAAAAAAVAVAAALAGHTAAAAAPPRPTLSFTPATGNAYEYGPVKVGLTRDQTFTLANTGGSASGRLTLALTGSPAFTTTADACRNSLGPGRTCAVTVRFAPTGGGTTTATLTATTPRSDVAARLALTGTAARQLYWTDIGAGSGGIGDGSIHRANLDGSEQQTIITALTYPYSVAVDTNHLYWTVRGASIGSIGRANLDGTNPDPTFVNGLSGGPVSVAVDDSHVYWAEYDGHSIGRANLDGSNRQTIVADLVGPEGGGPDGVAVDNNHLYWTVRGSSIGRANLDGTNPQPGFITGYNAFTLTVDRSHVYWTNDLPAGEGSIGRANLDGSNPDPTFITGLTYPIAVAIDQYLYWTHVNATGSIGRANLNGSNPDPPFVDGLTRPWGVAVDAP